MKQISKLPFHGWIGLLFIAVFWPLNWTLPGARTHWAFFPLWLGYCLFVDGLVYWRRGSSLATRSWSKYLGLFLVSAPAWWLFELLNLRVQNWVYDGRQLFTNVEYGILATLSFSTVVPAVFGTAELIASFDWLPQEKNGPIIRPTRKTTLGFFIAGWAMLACLLIWPRYCFPLLWLSLYCIMEPVNVWLGNRNLAQATRYGNWKPILALWLGVLVTAFFWEMWNFYSYPKWIYTVPFVDFWHIFEMPLLGYGGYLPFALELHALYHFIVGLLGEKESAYLRLNRVEKV
jgi:hypothetical protein